MGWPQITIIVLIAINITVAALKHGESRGKYNVVFNAIDAIVLVGVLYAGGFFS